MLQTILRYGIQKAVEGCVSPKELKTTVGEHIRSLLDETEQGGRAVGQIREALKNPQSIIELRSGKQVQTVTPDMPLRELLPGNTEEMEITISQPHVGG